MHHTHTSRCLTVTIKYNLFTYHYDFKYFRYNFIWINDQTFHIHQRVKQLVLKLLQSSLIKLPYLLQPRFL